MKQEESQTIDTAIVARGDTWRGLKVAPAFIELMRLARIANQLTLCYPPILAPLADQSPKARRERSAAILFAAAILHEGLHVAQSLGQHFRALPQYQEEFRALLGDRRVVSLNAALLDLLRDKAVCHVDRDLLARGLACHDGDEVTIATTPRGRWAAGEVYFDLADDAATWAVFGESGLSNEEYLKRVEDFLAGTAQIFQKFMRATHRLIPAALMAMGCEATPSRRPIVPEDETDSPTGIP